ncbi:hypothetical protein GH714_011341 [Hevea brasiliensis]|uniref:Uncharacterized protein n=1 Tax=Hevea brasiliensis TaxID=3981 RepID=A0A6A6MIE3_HEVBR|nr:hypothetical protein GH714_011341 [Hevea brasiliensis]
MNANDKMLSFMKKFNMKGVEANISVNPASGFNEEYNIGSNATTGGNEKVNIGENESTGMGADIEVKNDDNVLDEVDISEEKEEDNSAGDSDNEDSICEGLDANLIEGSDEDEDEELRVAREKVKSTKEGNLRELKKRMYLKYNLGQLKMMQDMKVMIETQSNTTSATSSPPTGGASSSRPSAGGDSTVIGSGKGIGSGRGSYSRKGIGSGRGSGSDVTDGVGMSSESSIRRGKLPNFGATTSSSQAKVRKTLDMDVMLIFI